MAEGEGTTGKLIDRSHPDYADIYERWQEEGQPGQFDREGAFGGAIYEVLVTQTGEVFFFQRASLGPTTVDEETGRVTTGWDFANERGMRVEVWEDREGQPRVRYVAPPNEL
jgi:hypothetical protein